MTKSKKAIERSSLRQNILAYREAIEYRLLGCLHSYSEVREIDASIALEWLEKAEAVLVSYEEIAEAHQFSPAALILKALLTLGGSLDAEGPLNKFKKLYGFDHEIDEFGFDPALAGLDSLQIDLIDQCLALVTQIADEEDTPWPTPYEEFDGLTPQQMRVRLIMRKCRLRRRAAEVRDDPLGVLDAINDHFIYLNKDFLEETEASAHSEFNKVEGGGRPELYPVFVALFRSQLDVAFRLVEKSETSESLDILKNSCFYLVENLGRSHIDRVSKFQSLPIFEQSQDALEQLASPIDEACSIITKTLLSVRHGCPRIDIKLRQRTERSLLELRVEALELASVGVSMRLGKDVPQSWKARRAADKAELEILSKVD